MMIMDITTRVESMIPDYPAIRSGDVIEEDGSLKGLGEGQFVGVGVIYVEVAFAP